MTDEELINFCRKGDRKSQSILYQRFIPSMGRLCLRYLKNEDDTKQVLTEGFLKVFAGIKKFEYRGKESLEVWIKKIMINESLMLLRKRKIFFVDINDYEIFDNNSHDSNISADEIYRMIISLPDGYRTVFNLYAIEGYSHQEIGKMLGITESSSRSQLSHARKKLQQLVKANQ